MNYLTLEMTDVVVTWYAKLNHGWIYRKETYMHINLSIQFSLLLELKGIEDSNL